jgi:hypothetical protein
MRLADTLPGEGAPVCVFESSAGEVFSVARPMMSREQEAALIEVLRDILRDEDLL